MHFVLLMDIFSHSSVWLLQVMPLLPFLNMCLFIHTCALLLVVHLGVELLGYMDMHTQQW